MKNIFKIGNDKYSYIKNENSLWTEVEMRKNDKIILGIILGIALIFGMYFYFFKKEGSYAVVKVDGQIYGQYSLKEERTIEIPSKDDNYNRLVITGGYADIEEASCPDKLCVHQKKIQKSGETLVCLPNKVIEIKSEEKNSLDGIAN